MKPDFFIDSDIAELPPLYRLAFQGLWCQADREGRLKDNPKELKIKILPYDDIDFEDVLVRLSEPKHSGRGNPFIVRYSVNGDRYIQILNFLLHQCPNVKEPESTIPISCEHGMSILGKEGKGKERKGNIFAETDKIAFDYRTGRFENIPDALRTQWTEKFPALDVLSELRKMEAWCAANPKNRKSNWHRFIVNWFSRSQDRAPRKESEFI